MPDGQKTRGDMGERRVRGGYDGSGNELDIEIPGSPEEEQPKARPEDESEQGE